LPTVCELAAAAAVPVRDWRAVEAPEVVEQGAAVQLPEEAVELQEEAQRAVAQKMLGPAMVTWLH
jgi:hypothetical protein